MAIISFSICEKSKLLKLAAEIFIASPLARLTSSAATIRRFFSSLGPGLITGAADDDPSGVATYSLAGAQFGTSLLWMAFFKFGVQTTLTCWPFARVIYADRPTP